MSKREERRIAIDLRRRGHSYSEIMSKLEAHGFKVSKGSLSNWLKGVALTPEQKERLMKLEEEGKEKGRQLIAEKRDAKK